MNTPRPPHLVPKLVHRFAAASASALLLVASPVFAQDPAPPAPPADPAAPATPPTPTGEAAPADKTTEPAVQAAAPDANANAALEDRLGRIEGQIEGLSEPFPAIQSDIAGLKRLKLSGYIQGRYDWHDESDYGIRGTAFDAAGNATATARREFNRFHVRRARLKTTYVGDMSEFVLQIDAIGDGVALRDAEASFVLTNENPWMPSATPWELKLTVGQFKVPFGFEVLQSSGDREMPERTLMVRQLFPGERDRGLRLQYTYDWFRVMAAVINGNQITSGSDPDHGTNDQSSWKDFAGRIGADFDFIVFGVSYHQGRNLSIVRRPTMANPIAGYERFSRTRVGGDVQLYFDVPSLGGLILRGETIWARDEQLRFAGVEPVADKCKDKDSFGWQATLVQNIGQHLGLVVRFDQYDAVSAIPDACKKASSTGATTAQTNLKGGRVSSIGGGLLGYISGNLKATAVYEHYEEQLRAVTDNDAFIFQLQAKF